MSRKPSLHALYRQFFHHYHQEEYWEAHEVLEELWQKERDNDFYHGLIQVAAIMHQLKRGKVRGARKLASTAYGYLRPFGPEHEGVDVDKVLSWLTICLRVLPEGVAQLEPKQVEFLGLDVCPLPRLHQQD